jgi:(2Fe-2S) ferredoxin
MEPFQFHVFVCMQEKPKDVPCCAASASGAVLEALTNELAARGLRDEVQVTTTNCMGTCENGPVLLAYPQGVWYSKVTPQDVPEIVSSHFCGGHVLDRLARVELPEMKAQIIEHREKYLAMLRAKAEAEKAAGLVAAK